MRMIVLENRANASLPGMLQLRPDDNRTLTLAPSRKAMLSANSDADRASMANMNRGRKTKGWPQPQAEKTLRRFRASRPCFRSCRADLKFACLSRDALRDDTTKSKLKRDARRQAMQKKRIRCSTSLSRNHDATSFKLLAASFEIRSLRRPHCRNEDCLRTRQNSQCQRQRRQGPYCYAHPKRPTKGCLGIQCREHAGPSSA
jgi:hypothetical protein